MQIVGIRARNVGFSRFPATLHRNTMSPTNIFDDARTRRGGWFGPAMFTVVEVATDAGVVGIGTAGAKHGAARELIATYYSDLLLGEDPRRHEYLWQRMFRSTVRFGRSGSAVAALSALDNACWDAHGKAEGKTVAELLGGRTQQRMPCYASRLYATDDLDALAEEARTWLAQGFKRMKQRFGWGPRDGREGMYRNLALVKTVRGVVGDGVDLAADAYMGWDLGYTLEMAKLLADYNLTWIEEPLMPNDIDGYVELKQRCPWQRWSCGEHSYTKWDFKELIDRRAVDILQPDCNRAGGITELVKICALAEAANLPVVPHSNEAHNLQVMFSRSPNVCPISEYFPNVEPDTGNELFWKVFYGTPEARDGSIEISDRPGLGITINVEKLEQLVVGDVFSAGDFRD